MDAAQANSFHFTGALIREDDGSALALLRMGRITIHSLVFIDAHGVKDTIPVLHAAINFEREQVASALLSRGADIDAPRIDHKGEARTPVGDAIEEGSVSALALCHRLGAKMSLFCAPGNPPENATAVGAAIKYNQSVCLAYLLDNLDLMRPFELNWIEMLHLSACANGGSHVKAVFEVLKTRGFNFEVLAKRMIPTAESRQMSYADLLVSHAQKSGDSAFLRYVVKDLGVASTVGGLDVSKATVNEMLAEKMHSMEIPDGPVAVALRKYECAACDVVGATMLCTGCRVVRYCSKDCSRKHWKTGGHKNECKELRRDAPPVSSSGSAGPS